MDDLGLARAVMVQATELASSPEFTLDTNKVLEIYKELPLAPPQSAAALEKRVGELFDQTTNYQGVEGKYQQIHAQSVDLIFSWLAENKHVPLVESSAFKELQRLRDEESVKQGEIKAEKEIEKAEQVVESIDAAVEGEQEFQDLVVPDSEPAGPDVGAALSEAEQTEQPEQVLEDEPVGEKSVAEREPEVEDEGEPVGQREPAQTEPEVKKETSEAQSEEPEEPEEPESSKKSPKELKSSDKSPEAPAPSDKSPTSPNASASPTSPNANASPKKESDAESTRSSAEPDDQKRKRTEDSGNNDAKRRRITKKRKPTQRALAWAKAFFSEQSVGFELDDPQVVIDYQEPSEIEEKIHDEEIDSLQDLVLAVIKTYADHTMANATPGELEVPIAEVDKWIKQLRLFP